MSRILYCWMIHRTRPYVIQSVENLYFFFSFEVMNSFNCFEANLIVSLSLFIIIFQPNTAVFPTSYRYKDSDDTSLGKSCATCVMS